MTEATIPWRAWATRWVGAYAPNLPALFIAVTGLAVEATLLGRVADSIWTISPLLAVTSALWLLWFWGSAAWVAYWTARGIAMVGRRGRGWRWGASAFCALAAAPLAVFYVASWSMYLRSGQFINLETLRFVWINPVPVADQRMEWLYAVETRKFALALLGVAAVPWLLVWLAKSRWPMTPATLQRGRRQRAVWCLTAVLLGGGVMLLESQPLLMTYQVTTGALRWRLNPLVAFATSWQETRDQEPIAPMLHTNDLVRISSFRWHPPRSKQSPAVILVKMESLRPDVIDAVHQGIEVTPHLNRLARGARVFARTYAQSTHTDYADVSVLTGLYPLWSREHRYYSAADTWPRMLLADLLRPGGYATAMVSAQNLNWGRMKYILRSPGLDFCYDVEASQQPWEQLGLSPALEARVRSMPLVVDHLSDRQTMDVAMAWLETAPDDGQPVFLNIHLQSAHFPYFIPANCPHPFAPYRFDFDASYLRYPVEKTPVVRNAYYNALHEADAQLGRLVEALREAGRLDDTILIVHGDHGELFYEHGQVTHARQPYEVAVLTACVLHAPRLIAPGVEDYPVELVDLAPTVLGLLKWPPHPNLQGIDVLSEMRPPLARRLVFMHTETPISRTDAVGLGGRWKYMHDRQTGREWLFDLATDPGETHDVAPAHPQLMTQLRETWSRWRQQQLAYYHFPFYHEHYYPPRPPVWTGEEAGE